MTIIAIVIIVLIIGIFGALIGSFANVVIYRLPAGKNIAYPGSSCPNCGHKIKPWENIPVISWLFLGAKCSSCKTPISFRYPLIEILMAVGFMLLALRWPVEIYGFTVLPLLIIYAMLLIMSLIDLDHLYLPDSLTLPAIFIAIGAAAYYQPLAGLPSLAEAAVGSAVAAGIIALINRLGSLIVRRMADTKERLWPIGMDQVNIAFVFGALGGWVWGLGFALLSVIVNLIARKPIRLEEKYMYLLWFVAIALSATKLIVSPVESLAGTFIAAGIVVIVGSFYWWFHEIFTGVAEDEDFDEPVAMGFGDVKLAAILGAILGWQSMLVALFLAFIIGAVVGVVVKIMGGSRIIPFGPPLVLGALIALFYGQQIISWYLGMLT